MCRGARLWLWDRQGFNLECIFKDQTAIDILDSINAPVVAAVAEGRADGEQRH
jgi:hypothetical protein